jgi:hypothetical protein
LETPYRIIPSLSTQITLITLRQRLEPQPGVLLSPHPPTHETPELSSLHRRTQAVHAHNNNYERQTQPFLSAFLINGQGSNLYVFLSN